MIAFELDPNLVRPGWTALIIVIVLALIMVGLFISMRRQLRKINVPAAAAGPEGDDHPGADRAAEGPADDRADAPRDDH